MADDRGRRAEIIGLYYVAPNVRPPSWPWLPPGAMLAVVVWALTSAQVWSGPRELRLLYQDLRDPGRDRHLPDLVWLTNVAVLLGIELDSEIERERQLSIDQPGAATQIERPLPPRMNSSPSRS